MAGESYAAGGIRTTVAATRAATDEQLAANVGPARRGDAAPGHHHRRDQERLRAEHPRRGARPGDRAAVHRRDHLPRRPRGAAGVRRGPGRLRRPRHRPDARGGCPAREVDRRLLRDRCLRRRPGQDDPGRRAGEGARAVGCTPTSSVPVPAYAWPASSASTAVDHCTFLDDADVSALADSGTVATLLPGVEFSTRSPYPDARGLLDAGVTVALASDCNPGSCYTSSMPLCVALAVREMRMTPAEARLVGHRRRRAGRSTATTSACSPPASGPTSPCSRPRRTSTSPTDPASPWSPRSSRERRVIRIGLAPIRMTHGQSQSSR